MLMNPAHVPGETVGQLYNRMVAYARTLRPALRRRRRVGAGDGPG